MFYELHKIYGFNNKEYVLIMPSCQVTNNWIVV